MQKLREKFGGINLINKIGTGKSLLSLIELFIAGY